MDKIQVLMATISSIIAAISLIYKLGLKKEHQRERKYYEQLLVPFMEKYFESKNINPCKFCRGRVKYTDEHIPAYIMFLLRNGDGERLKKVLVNDYFDLCNNDDNKILRTMESVVKVSRYVEVFVALLIWAGGSYLTVLALLSIVLEITTDGDNIVLNLGYVLLGAVLMGISLVLFKITAKDNRDRYTLTISKIEKQIKAKVNTYEKTHLNYFC